MLKARNICSGLFFRHSEGNTMATSNAHENAAQQIDRYLAALSAERRDALQQVRAVILKNLPPGIEESFGFGMIAYVVPLSRFPKTYNGQPLMLAALASQKNYMAVHLLPLYGDRQTLDWFVSEYKKSGKRLDMGKACVRFKTLDDLPLELIGKTIARCSPEKLLAMYQKSHSPEARGARRETREKSKRPVKKKAAAKKRPRS
jgi:hypothetical protein